MAIDFWKIGDNYAFYVDIEHKEIHRSIKRSKKWEVMTTYQRNNKVTAIQYRVPGKEYEKAWRLFNRAIKTVDSCD